MADLFKTLFKGFLPQKGLMHFFSPGKKLLPEKQITL
jgi:hypothetical protein